MDGLLRGVGLIAFGVGLTWLLSVVLGRLVSRRGLAFWVWDRSGSIGRVLIAVGFALALLGLAQGPTAATGSSLVLLGSLVGMAGIWLILPGP
jgi:hypothetical protein